MSILCLLHNLYGLGDSAHLICLKGTHVSYKKKIGTLWVEEQIKRAVKNQGGNKWLLQVATLWLMVSATSPITKFSSSEIN
jgi:hypothetical protein